MYDYTGWLARSIAGRDKGKLFWVIGEEDERLLLSDGKSRRVERPKRKKRGHIVFLTDEQSMYDHPVIQKLRGGTLPSNKELRHALAAYRAEHKEG